MNSIKKQINKLFLFSYVHDINIPIYFKS